MTDAVSPAPDVTDLPTTTVAADAPVSETVERFLRAIVAQVPVERIEELHLFSPLRQGTVETGIAVLAARALIAVPVEAEPELAFDAAAEPPDMSSVEVTPEASTAEASPDAPVEASADGTRTEMAETSLEEAPDAPEAPDASAVVEPRESVERHTVYTARYRYVIKGPERGKWEADLKAEADAPLVTVETVVRGVQRRAGEESEIVRYTGAQIARALRR